MKSHLVKNNLMQKKISYIILLSILSLTAFPQSNPFPEEPSAWVNDYANILSGSEVQYLNRKLGNYEDTTSTQIFIVTMNDHQDMPIEMMGAEIGETWGVGQQGKHNGIIILIYPGNKQITIQTGYGLEQYIPDALAKRIIENEIKPRFRNNDYAGGLDAATDVMTGLLSGQFTAEEYRKQSSAGNAPLGIFIFFILFFILFGRSRRRRFSTMGRGLPFWIALGMLSGSSHRHSGSWNSFSSGSGSFGGGGGFSGGGGGSFGGGGASGSW